MNGIEATRYIKQFKKPPVIILVTGQKAPETLPAAKAAGADALVYKDQALCKRLHEILQEFANRRAFVR